MYRNSQEHNIKNRSGSNQKTEAMSLHRIDVFKIGLYTREEGSGGVKINEEKSAMKQKAEQVN